MLTQALPRRVYHGDAVHSISLTEVEYLKSALIGVDEAGVIAFVEKVVLDEEIPHMLDDLQWTGAEVVKLKQGEFLCPGFIDTHTHAPQYVNLSFGQQYELLDWLKNVTFPAEEKFSNSVYARRSYEGVVERVINSGTTTCCYYGTLHLTTKILAAVCHRKGQRAFVGKCNMDRESSPTYQEKSASKSIMDTKEFVAFVRSQCVSPTLDLTTPKSVSRERPRTFSEACSKQAYCPTSLVQPILTPRFAISCSDALLASLGAMMAKDPTLPCQTHLAENPTEIEYTKTLFPFAKGYTFVYDHFDLLRENTILAHCVHLEVSEMDLIKSRNSGISHCPTSNFNLRSGISKVPELLDRGIKVGLGTDVSGGFSLGILTAIRQASIASKTVTFNNRDAATSAGGVPLESKQSAAQPPSDHAYPAGFFSERHLSFETLFYLATLGGAEVCNLSERIGTLTPGKEFDALLIQTGQKSVEQVKLKNGELSADTDEAEEALLKSLEDQFPDLEYNPSMFIEPEDTLQKIFEKFLFSGDDRNIGSVFVRGRCIGGARPIVSN